MPTANRRLLWAIITPVEKTDKTLCDDGFMASELGPEAIEEMCTKYQHFGCPIGGTMKDIFDQSPPHLMSRSLTHERVHDKWCGGRTVLVGNGKLFVPLFFFFFALAFWARARDCTCTAHDDDKTCGGNQGSLQSNRLSCVFFFSAMYTTSCPQGICISLWGHPRLR